MNTVDLFFQTNVMRVVLPLILTLIAISTFAQKNKSKFARYGNISKEDLQKQVYEIDSSANAVILYDVAEVYLEGNSKNSISLFTKRHKIIHILNKNGYDLAKEEIRLYNDLEEIEKFRATTYNLEGDKIVTTGVDKSSKFIEKIDEDVTAQKFTFPQVREGSIIEFEYVTESRVFWQPDTWYFQSLDAPTLYSEFNFDIPQFLNYNFLAQGYHPIAVSERKESTQNFYFSVDGQHRSSLPASVNSYKWAMKDVPALKYESFTTSLNNHISRMEFQLSSVSQPLTPKSYSTTWADVVTDLLKSENFGQKLSASNNWMSEDLKPIIQSGKSDMETAMAIYYYVKDNFKCTRDYGLFLNQSLRNIFKSKSGNVAEINILLTAMLRYAGFEAHPVLVSTRNHGYAYVVSPMLKSMNYVITTVNIGDKVYYLDATNPYIGFGKLPLDCFNGFAVIANAEASPVSFDAAQVNEQKRTVLFVNNLENHKWGGKVRQVLGYYESEEMRKKISEKGKEEIQKQLQSEYRDFATVENVGFDWLDEYEKPAVLTYELDLNVDGEDLLYFSPVMVDGLKKNPFSGSERHYPVEMPYCMDESVQATIEIPEGYTVDELPKSVKMLLDEEGKSFFEYRISVSSNLISFVFRTKISQAFFAPEEYPVLKEFFNQIYKKQSERIVFKKM